MKKDIHPKYFSQAQVKCVCGAAFTIGSVLEKIEVEVCSQCHPFYTGDNKIIDTGGRVERFKKRMAAVKKPVPKSVEKVSKSKKSEEFEEKKEEEVLK